MKCKNKVQWLYLKLLYKEININLYVILSKNDILGIQNFHG